MVDGERSCVRSDRFGRGAAKSGGVVETNQQELWPMNSIRRMCTPDQRGSRSHQQPVAHRTRSLGTGELRPGTTPDSALCEGVSRALNPRRRWLGVGVVALGIAAAPLAGAAPFPPVFELASLFPAGGGDGSRGFVLTGADARDYAGASVSGAGDVNGDGIDDVIVGAYRASPAGLFDAGESYVVFGSTQGFPAVLPLANLFPAGGGDGSRGFVIAGSERNDRAGFPVSAAGDVNGDGVDDLVVGASNSLVDAGESYVIFGSAQDFPAVFRLTSLFAAGGGDGSRGFVISGIDRDQLGISVGAAGDVNGDGIDDLVVGANDARMDVGATYIVFGSTQGFPPVFRVANLFPAQGGDGSQGFVLVGVEEDDHSGRSASAAGDVNGDGVDDLIIGAYYASSGGVRDAGESYVVFGSTQGFPPVFPLATLFPAAGGDGSRGFVLPGTDGRGFVGWSVSAAGDINHDGIDDVIIGGVLNDVGEDYDAGESFVVFGSIQGFPAVLPLAGLFSAGGGDGSDGFVLSGIDNEDQSGGSVSAAGDVNGDGIDDLIVGAMYAAPLGMDAAGESYVVFGSTQDFPAVFRLASLFPAAGGDGSAGFVLAGVDERDRSGVAVSEAGDVNGDGMDDLIIGAFRASPNGMDTAGEAYVVFGSVIPGIL
jgi:hypothetical protein